MDQPFYDNLGKLMLRLTVGGLMLFHGISKIGNDAALSWISGHLAGVGLPGFLAYAVFIGEIIAPVMIVAGTACRAGAVLLIVNMLVAIGLAHGDDILSLGNTGGWELELQGFYLFGAVAIVLFGSGRYAFNPD